jgi:hypothetical protein
MMSCESCGGLAAVYLRREDGPCVATALCHRCLATSITEVEYLALSASQREGLNAYIDGVRANAYDRTVISQAATPAANPVAPGVRVTPAGRGAQAGR